MKVLFAHDHKFCCGKNGLYYSLGQFPYQLRQAKQVKRYLREASLYDKSALDQIRREFWLDFRHYCEMKSIDK